MNYVVRGQRGSVLIMVLWVLALLTMIVAYYANQVRILRNAAQYTFSSIQGEQAVLSVLRLVANHLSEVSVEDSTEDDTLKIVPQRVYLTHVGSLDVRFEVENEAGKIDLNRVKEDFLRGFLRYLLAEENPKRADTICDGILDWRDRDKLTHINGAEDETYEERDPPYHAANGPFKTLDELLLVNGVTTRLFYGPIESPNIPEGWKGGLKDLFTIYNGKSSVNPDLAPAPLRNFLEEKADLGFNGKASVWLLKVSAASRLYRIYWEKIGKAPGYKIVFWTEGVGH